jgi:HK97 family phage portal protein
MFLRGASADAADRSPWGSFWFSPIGMATTSGARVSGDGALALTAAWSSVKNISEDFAKLPFRLYKPRATGGKDEVKDHWLYRLFAKAPNNWQTPFEWREMLEGHLLLRGNAFNRIIEDGMGGIAQFIPMHPDRTKMELLDNGSFRYRFRQLDGSEVILARGQVWHIRGLSSDGYMGYNPVQVQRQMLGVAMSRQDYAARFFTNDAKPTGGWIEYPGRFADLAAKLAFKESWKKAQGGKNGGSVAVLEKGMKYHEVGFNNKDSQFIEASGMSVVEVARMFRIPPHKIGELSQATFSNIEQQNIEYATDCINSWCERWESSIQNALLGIDGPDSELEVDFDISNMTRGDMAARSTYINMGVINGTLLRNEAREMEGRNPIEGLDKPLVPLNMATIDPDGDIEQPEGADAAPDSAPPADDAPADDSAARLQMVIRGNAGRMARRVATRQMPSMQVLSEALGISEQRAANWLASLPDEPSLEEGPLTDSLLRLALKDPK